MKSTKPRGNMEIKKEILKLLREGETVPTRIQHKVNISNTVITRYLSNLKNNGLIKESKSNSSNAKRFSLTEKGEEYLKMIEKTYELLHY
jgi:predicted transcriptional regulator